jgi:DNA-binding beta-propeller fold protein YncE
MLEDPARPLKPSSPATALTYSRHLRCSLLIERLSRVIGWSSSYWAWGILSAPAGEHSQPKNISINRGPVMQIKQTVRCALRRSMVAASLGFLAAIGSQANAADAFIPRAINSSTVPSIGDVNPYGVAFVPAGFPAGGTIAAGDVLVSNFNNSANLQGAGTTIIQLTPRGTLAPPGSAVTFFTSGLAGLSTALGVLKTGFVLVGNVPTTDGSFATIGQGALQVIDRHGHWLQTWTDPVFLDGPWDLALDDDGLHSHVFVSNVLNGTVSRLDVAVESGGLKLLKRTTIAIGYMHVPNTAALVLGPTGLAFDEQSDTLYVASTGDNAIFAITAASQRTGAVKMGNLVFADSHLRGPLALRFAPNGNLLTANGDAVNMDVLHPSEIVEFTKWGQFVREYNVDASQGGAFGIDAVRDGVAGFNYAVIDDVTNSLSVIDQPVD